MSKKHFIALADKIKAVQSCDYVEPFTEKQISVLGCFCMDQNPRFNMERWLGYIHGQCGKNGGKVKQAA